MRLARPTPGVIPAKAGIEFAACTGAKARNWISALAGMTS